MSVGNTIWVLRDEFCRIPISTLTLTGTYIHLSMTVFVFFHIFYYWEMVLKVDDQVFGNAVMSVALAPS